MLKAQKMIANITFSENKSKVPFAKQRADYKKFDNSKVQNY
jgi:hypothetical protein